MSASDIFTIGSSGLRTYQTQLSTISQNITNAGSQDYSRRTTTVRESAASTATAPLYLQRANFSGSEAQGVYRATDPLLDEAVRLAGSALGFADAKLHWAGNVENALDDTSTGVGQSLTAFYGAMEQLAANPANNSLRANAMYKLEQAVGAFHATSDRLGSVLTNAKSSADGDVTIVNTAMSQLQEINKALLRAPDGTSAKASLLDSRDALIQTISEKMNVSISYGSLGDATLSYGGQVVASTNDLKSFAVTQASDGTLSLTVDGAAVASPTDGSLGGTFAGAAMTRDALAKLDTLAVQWANGLNTWHTGGLTNSNAAGGPMVSVGTTAASLTVVIGGISDMALANATQGANGNLLQLSAMRTSNGTERDWSTFVTEQGNAVSSANAAQITTADRYSAAQDARDRVSGVNLDQEAADLLRVQQAYQACAKVIQAAREIVDSILNLN